MGSSLGKIVCTRNLYLCEAMEPPSKNWGDLPKVWARWAVGWKTMAAPKEEWTKGQDVVTLSRQDRTVEFTKPHGTVFAGRATQLDEIPKATILVEKIGENGLNFGVSEGPGKQRGRICGLFHYKADLVRYIKEGDEVTIYLTKRNAWYHDLHYSCPRWEGKEIVVKTKVWTPNLMLRLEGSTGTKITILDGPSVNGIQMIEGKTLSEWEAMEKKPTAENKLPSAGGMPAGLAGLLGKMGAKKGPTKGAAKGGNIPQLQQMLKQLKKKQEVAQIKAARKRPRGPMPTIVDNEDEEKSTVPDLMTDKSSSHSGEEETPEANTVTNKKLLQSPMFAALLKKRLAGKMGGKLAGKLGGLLAARRMQRKTQTSKVGVIGVSDQAQLTVGSSGRMSVSPKPKPGKKKMGTLAGQLIKSEEGKKVLLQKMLQNKKAIMSGKRMLAPAGKRMLAPAQLAAVAAGMRKQTPVTEGKRMLAPAGKKMLLPAGKRMLAPAGKRMLAPVRQAVSVPEEPEQKHETPIVIKQASETQPSVSVSKEPSDEEKQEFDC